MGAGKAAVFDYRHPLGLLIATAIVVGTIWAIFDFGMSQDFPTATSLGRNKTCIFHRLPETRCLMQSTMPG